MLSVMNIESELSYSYLHAVASHAGFACYYSHRHLDNAGIDAEVKSEGHMLSDDSLITSLNLQVQLKATFTDLVVNDGRISYSIPVSLYDKLRKTNLGATLRILVLLRLPKGHQDWLVHSTDGLLARRCAYWVSLFGAPEVEGQDNRTIYIPEDQVLNSESLKNIMLKCSKTEAIPYAP